MTNEYDFTGYERYAANRRRTADINKVAVFDALAAAGITSVTAEFDGEGDSGGIEAISASIGDTPAELPPTRIPFQHARYGADVADKTEQALREAIEQLCYDYLSEKHGGWENNEGGFGTFSFDVAARTIALEFNGRFTDVTTSICAL